MLALRALVASEWPDAVSPCLRTIAPALTPLNGNSLRCFARALLGNTSRGQGAAVFQLKYSSHRCSFLIIYLGEDVENGSRRFPPVVS